MDYDALLRAMNPGQPVDQRQRETIRVLAETLARTTAGGDSNTFPALSPSAERALREFAVSADGEALRRVLERLGANPTGPDDP